MAIFTYIAVDKNGVRRTGNVDAHTKNAAVNLLKEEGLYVLSLQEKRLNINETIGSIRGVPFTEVVSFTRQLATMIDAGLTVTKALDVLAQQTTNPKFKSSLLNILRDVEGGAALANAFGRYPEIFSTTYQALVRAGEASGKLDTILMQLADTMEAQRDLRSKFKAAMIYPVIVTLAMAGVFVILMVFVIPKLANMYTSLDVELPLITKIMIGVSDFMSHNLVLLAILGIFAVVGLKYLAQTEIGRGILSMLAFRTPVFGKINKKRELTEFTSTLALLITSAVPIVDALHIVANVVNNPGIKGGARNAATSIEKGGSLSSYLKSDSTFPPLLGNMVETGEATGRLDEVLKRVSEFFRQETEHAVAGLSAALEPVILIMLGVMVGFMIISIIVPIYQITTAI